MNMVDGIVADYKAIKSERAVLRVGGDTDITFDYDSPLANKNDQAARFDAQHMNLLSDALTGGPL
jgi:hypothetical protein